MKSTLTNQRGNVVRGGLIKARIRQIAAVTCAALCTASQAYVGYFDPQPMRNSVEITFVDSQVPGISCAAMGKTLADMLLLPVIVQAVACASYDQGIVVAPLTPGVGQLYGLSVLATPNQILGHETRHLFDGDFHPYLLPFAERVRRPDQAAGVMVPSDQYASDMRR